MKYVAQGECCIGLQANVLTQGIQNCSVAALTFATGEVIPAHIDGIRNVHNLYADCINFAKNIHVSYTSVTTCYKNTSAFQMGQQLVKKLQTQEGAVGMSVQIQEGMVGECSVTATTCYKNTSAFQMGRQLVKKLQTQEGAVGMSVQIQEGMVEKCSVTVSVGFVKKEYYRKKYVQQRQLKQHCKTNNINEVSAAINLAKPKEFCPTMHNVPNICF